MKGFLCILKDNNEKIYIGSTANLDRRLHQHRRGETATTRKMKGINLVFSQEFDSIENARRIENKLKNFKRRDFIDKIIADGFVKKL